MSGEGKREIETLILNYSKTMSTRPEGGKRKSAAQAVFELDRLERRGGKKFSFTAAASGEKEKKIKKIEPFEGRSRNKERKKREKEGNPLTYMRKESCSFICHRGKEGGEVLVCIS